MSDNTLFTRREVENARTKGQVIGWVQGGGAVLVGTLLLGFAGWIPIILLGGVAVYVAYRVIFGRSTTSGTS